MSISEKTAQDLITAINSLASAMICLSETNVAVLRFGIEQREFELSQAHAQEEEQEDEEEGDGGFTHLGQREKPRPN